MGPSAIIYCDESGNDGPNYLNQIAPFYVLAGWAVPEATAVSAAVEVELLRQKFCRDAAELAFKILRRRPWAISQLICRLGEIGLVPIYVVAEKRFCVAAKIVDTFLDPYFNDAVGARFHRDSVTKKEIANTLYERLSDACLVQFAEAYRSPGPAVLKESLTRIMEECTRLVNPEIVQLLQGSRRTLTEIAEAEVSAVAEWGKSMATLNLPCLVSFMKLVDDLGRANHFHPKKIVHDEQGAYQAEYHELFKYYKNPANQPLPSGDSESSSDWIKTIDDFEVQRSVDQPLIQAADLLAGSIAHLCAALIRDRGLQEQEIELGGFVLPALIVPGPLLANPICSERMLHKIGEAIRLAYPKAGDAARDDGPKYFHCTNNVPEGPLPVFPASPVRTESNADSRADSRQMLTVKIDLPLFALANNSGDLLVVAPPDVPIESASRFDKRLPLWLRRAAAEEFRESEKWTAPQHVVEFGPHNLRSLIDQLRWQAQSVEYAAIVNDDIVRPWPVLGLADVLERIRDRTERAANAGALDVLLKKHHVKGHSVLSLLMSSGEYAAMRESDGLRAEAVTRDAAVAKLAAMID